MIGTHDKLNLEYLLAKCWEKMELVRVYTKKRGCAPDIADPVVISDRRTKGCTVESFCRSIHKTMVDNFNYAVVWGRSVKHHAQQCGLSHVLEDEDVVQIVTLTVGQQRRDANYAQKCQAAYDKYKKRKAQKTKRNKLKT